MTAFWLVLVLVGGLCLGIQPALNARLAHHLGHPVSASLVSFATATILLAALLLVLRPVVPALTQLRMAPPWVWGGGLLGAAFVTIALIATPRLGAATTIAVVVCGQMLAALLIDHFGLFELEVRSIDWTRVTGALLLVAGVVLLRWH